jgi:hypothetical protein
MPAGQILRRSRTKRSTPETDMRFSFTEQIVYEYNSGYTFLYEDVEVQGMDC